MRHHFKAALAAAALATAGSPALAEPGVTDDKIVLGAVDPLTGPPSLRRERPRRHQRPAGRDRFRG
jgi:hypothetical protein